MDRFYRYSGRESARYRTRYSFWLLLPVSLGRKPRDTAPDGAGFGFWPGRAIRGKIRPGGKVLFWAGRGGRKSRGAVARGRFGLRGRGGLGKSKIQHPAGAFLFSGFVFAGSGGPGGIPARETCGKEAMRRGVRGQNIFFWPSGPILLYRLLSPAWPSAAGVRGFAFFWWERLAYNFRFLWQG